jgi:predicted PolB exonuclease-like 3'-5' exonuclease
VHSPFLPIYCHKICCLGAVIFDDKNKIDAVRDVGIKDGKVAAVA